MPHTQKAIKLQRVASENYSSQIMQELEHHMNAQLALCDKLEAIADSLPEKILRQSCLFTAQQIYPIVKAAHEFEEIRIFPILEQHTGDTRLTVDRLHGEHWSDEEYSHELSESLREFVAGRDTNSEKLGYMLRGFFEGLRRHIAFEREFIAPILVRVGAELH